MTISPDLHLIPLDQDIRGFTRFIGVWLYRGERTFLVDVGPAATVPHLLEALADLGITRLDAILLTHIHLDHAGGIGDVARSFPETPVFCHEVGIPHLADPSRLWEGSLKTLGDTARAYGEISAVPAQQLRDAASPPWDEVSSTLTPGHSPHHVSYQIPPYLFAGETGGVLRSLDDGHEYLRPATPPRFFLETALGSIDALIALEPDSLCYGHFGIRSEGKAMLQKHREQLIRWEETIAGVMEGHRGEDISDACLDALFGEDPLLAAYSHLTDAEQERERFFLINSIRGYVGYLQQKDASSGRSPDGHGEDLRIDGNQGGLEGQGN